MSNVEKSTELLADYVPLREAAKQPNMPGWRTLQRWASERRLDGLMYGRRPFISISAFRAGFADPEAARAEWEAEFRTDRSNLFDEQVIEDAVDDGHPLELPPPGLKYFAFTDASAGRPASGGGR
jgi:hypothetical protein